MKTIKGDLILTEDTIFNEDIKVEGNIFGKDGERFDLKVNGDINAWNINVLDINAWNINARDINAWNIDAGNIYALDIDAGDIYALDIDAGNISYYAVCFTYKDIVCKSIKGQRENCKHFVLDGEIKMKGNKPLSSKKRKCYTGDTIEGCEEWYWHYPDYDVKEFIRLLKEDACRIKCSEFERVKFIQKLNQNFGDKLI